jgi:predicted NUDIX family NTP pyrophosphohydrolase
MAKPSAGLLVYRFRANGLEVFLVHPGGPLWKNKDEWSIPKGEYTADEEPLGAAKREFVEETGFNVPAGRFLELKPIKQPSGKVVTAWAIEGDFDATKMKSNLFSMEWPPKSGKHQEFPEVDKGAWFDLETARNKIFKGQAALLDELEKAVKENDASGMNHQ